MTAPALTAARVRATSLADRLDARVVVLVVLYVYFLALVAVGGHDHWDRFYVPDLSPSFLDLRSVTSAWECTRKGVEVLAQNPCDPWGRPANYPRLWLVPSSLGLGQGSTVVLGLVTAVLFFGSFFTLLPRRTAIDGLVYGLALISPAVMLGVERGNADLLLFPLLVGAVFLLRGRGPEVRAAGHAALLFAGMLKLFPAFAFAVLARQPRRWRLIGGGGVIAAFAVYVLVTLDDIRTILKVVPKEVWFSYGSGVGTDAVRHWLGHDVSKSLDDATLAKAVTAVLVLAALAVAAWLASRRIAAAEAQPSALALDAFVVGAAIYVGSFAVMHNWDYRLTFLLLTLPQLVAWARGGPSPVPAPRVTLAAVLGTLWLSEYLSIRNPAAPLEELLNWLVFVTFCAALLVLLAPRAVARLARSA